MLSSMAQNIRHCKVIGAKAYNNGMPSLRKIGQIVATTRVDRGLRQVDLADKAGLSRATIDALENGRASDIGVSRLCRVLSVLGLELSIIPAANRRPTLDDLMKEDADD
jgi:transcriptional regulator with XRE-family HTH domain